MSERTFFAMGTEWFLRADACDPAILERAQQRVLEEERRFSRFNPESTLSRLNARRTVRDAVFASVMRRALSFRRRTHGAFEPAVGDAVVAAGYDRTFEQLAAAPLRAPGCDTSRPEIVVRGPRVELHGEGAVDLGGIVKGWTVDEIARSFEEAGACAYVVDGGGDIRVGMPAPGEREWAIGAGDQHMLGLTSGAVATSSSCRRRWATTAGEAHHIIAPATGQPAHGAYVTAAVVAPDAMTADVLGTALIADGEAVLPTLPRFHAEALLCTDQGTWVMTPGLEGLLRP